MKVKTILKGFIKFLNESKKYPNYWHSPSTCCLDGYGYHVQLVTEKLNVQSIADPFNLYLQFSTCYDVKRYGIQTTLVSLFLL